jgi:hypothetical protein
MSTTRLAPGVRVVRGLAAVGAAGMLSLFAGTAAAHADGSDSTATSTSAAESSTADAQTSTATSAAAAPLSVAANSSSAESSSASSNCPSVVQIVLGSTTVSGGTVTVSFTHTGTECPDAASSVLHVHENLLSTPNSGSDAVHQLNRDYDVTPGFANSVSLPLLDAVEGKCFVQVDVHAGGVNHGRFFPTETCPSESVSPSQSVSASSTPSQVVNPPSPPAATSSSRPVPPASSPAPLVNASSPPPALASTGSRAQNPLLLGISLLLAGSLLLAVGRPGSRWRDRLRFASTLWANGRH